MSNDDIRFRVTMGVLAALGVGCLIGAIWAPRPALAAECAYTIAVTDPDLTARGVPHTVIDDPEDVAAAVKRAEEVTHLDLPDNVTRVMFASVQAGQLYIGLEVDGCLLDPIAIAVPVSVPHASTKPPANVEKMRSDMRVFPRDRLPEVFRK